MYNKTTLSNGVRIITEEIPHVRSVCLGFWVGAGSRDEDDNNNGIAHFIEHMMFKGTENRTAKEIAEALDAVGGQLNAFTSKEYTCYYARVLDEHLNIAIDLLGDMFFNSLFKEEDIEKEKNVIIEEIKMYEDAPDELVHDIFASTLWKGHALGKPILGTEEIIKRQSRENLISFRDRLYSPDSLVVAAAGNVRHDEIIEKLGPLFEKLKNHRAERRYVSPKVHSNIQSRKKDTEQVHLCIGTPGLPMDHQDTYVLHVLNSVLGGGISSRLFQEIREERGLAYSVYTYQSSYRDAGLFSVYAGLSQNNLNQVVSLVAKEMKDFRMNGITEGELDRAKQQIKGSMYLGLESVSNRMSRMGKSELCLNRVVTVDEAVKKINNVTHESVKNLADYLFRNQNIVVTSIGPELDKKRLEVCLD